MKRPIAYARLNAGTPKSYKRIRRRSRRLALVGVSLAVAIVADGLTIRPAIAEVERNEARELPALQSSRAPEPSFTVPEGDFRNPPPVGGSSEDSSRFTGFDPDRSTVDSRTESRTTFLNPDGSRTTRVHTTPVNYKDSSGSWKPIDTTVESDPAGGYRNTAGSVRFKFDSSSNSSDVVEASGDGWVFGFSVDGGATGRAAQTQGSEVTYPNVFTDADLSFRVEPEGLKELVVLKRRPSSSGSVRYSFPLTTSGLRPVAEAGGVVFYDADGEVAGRIPDGTMWDSAARPAEAPVTVSLARRNGRSVVDLDVDGSFLADPARVYPVFIDPTFYAGAYSAQWDAYVLDTSPNSNYQSATLNKVGKSAAGVHRSFQSFDLAWLNDKQILGANWKGYFTVAGSSQAIGLRPVDVDWTASTLTWNNQPATRSELITDNATTGWKTIPITDWVTNWTTSGPTHWPNRGLRVATTESGTSYYKEMASAQYSDAVKRPYLEITYNTFPPAPTASAPTDGATALTTQPVLQVNPVSDPDGDPVSYFFRVTTNANAYNGGGTLVDSGWLSSASWTVPAASLDDGVTYYWTAWTSDGIGISWPSWVRSFKVDALGSLGAIEDIGPATVNMVTGNLSVQTASPSYPTVSGDVSLSYSYNSFTPSDHGLKATFFKDANQNRVFDTSEELTNRVDRIVDFFWDTASPQAGVPADNFLVRWEGKVTIPNQTGFGGNYFFGAASDDGVRIWVNNSLVLDRWFNQTASSPVYGSSVNLAAGQVADIKVEYYDATGAARMMLALKGPGVPNDLAVPASWLSTLSTEQPALPTGWSLSADADGELAYVRAVVTNDAVTLVGGDGATSEYRKTTTGYTPPIGEHGVLAIDAATGKLVLQAEDGIVYTFRSDGALESAQSTTNELASAAPIYTWSGTPSRLTAVTDPVSGRSVTLTYGGGSCPTPPAGGFDPSPPANMLCRVTYWDGNQTQLFYVSGQLGRIQDPGGEVTDFAYASGKLTKIRDPLAADAVAAGQRSDDDTTRTLVTYDGVGRVSSVELPAPIAGALRPKSSYIPHAGYTDVDVEGMAGQAGYDRRVEFDGMGRTLKDYGPDGLYTSYGWDATVPDKLLWQTDPAGRRQTTVYDAESRPTDTYGPAPASWFDSAGVPLTQYTT